MTWPQFVILCWLLFGTVTSVRDQVKDRSQSSGWSTFGVFLVLALQGAIAGVLHAGGFW